MVAHGNSSNVVVIGDLRDFDIVLPVRPELDIDNR
jgi:hypothetical protein